MTLDVSAVEQASDLTISWCERGGPLVKAPARGDVLGSSMVKRSVSSQLGGPISYDWSEAGVIVTLIIKQACLTR